MDNAKSTAKIDYVTLLNMIKQEKMVVVAYVESVVQDLIKEFQPDEFSQLDENGDVCYENSVQCKMNTLANFFLDDTLSFYGTSSEFHNLAVNFSRQEINRGACFIIDRGIKLRPASVDLLADFLLYGREVPERRKDCVYYYEILSKLPRTKWNWRAFSFSIAHLLESRFYSADVEDEKRLKAEALKLSKEFISRFNKENADQEYIDRAYSDMASVYQAFGDPVNEYKTLKSCTDKYSRVPITALRLSEIMFSSGDYGTATQILNKCVQALNPQPSVNQGYIFLLRAYCHASIFLSESRRKDKSTVPENIVSEIYTDLDTSERLIANPTYEKAISTLRSIMETQVKYADTDEIVTDRNQW